MAFRQIPDSILKQPDRALVFQELKTWMHNELQTTAVGTDDAIASGSQAVDQKLAGGYAPGRITEIVEPLPSRGAQSMIHHALAQARRQLRYVALIDANNQFDPQSECTSHLECLLWVRISKIQEIVKACDILIRDGNFSLLILDLRNTTTGRKHYIRANEWYRIQRVCEKSRVAFVAFTDKSTIPCAHSRLQLTSALPPDIFDQPLAEPVSFIECESLKQHSFRQDSLDTPPSTPVCAANRSISGSCMRCTAQGNGSTLDYLSG